MEVKILSEDPNYDEWCEEEILRAYKEAAEHDQFLFGDFDYKKVWMEASTNDVL